jgi:hypothetical protein
MPHTFADTSDTSRSMPLSLYVFLASISGTAPTYVRVIRCTTARPVLCPLLRPHYTPAVVFPT